MMRASGILLPISSIPSNYGIGCFSKEAYAFVDQLAEALDAERVKLTQEKKGEKTDGDTDRGAAEGAV